VVEVIERETPRRKSRRSSRKGRSRVKQRVGSSANDQENHHSEGEEQFNSNPHENEEEESIVEPVAVASVEFSNPKHNPKDIKVKLNIEQGLTSRDGDEVYFMGVIDILITWDSYKRAERLLKSVQYDRDKISAVPPDMYAERFTSFIDTCID